MPTPNTPVFSLEHFLQPERLGNMIAAAVLVLLGWFLARTLAGLFEKSMQHRLNQHQLLVRRRLIYHGILLLFIMAALQAVGLNLSVLLGAAGILSVAIGFASQTSASNLISGIFLIGERSFAIGDTIRVGQTEGEVMSIDLLSVKLRTADNLYVRLPNEQLIKSELTNLTRFAIRRISLPVGIAYKEDINRVRHILLRVASEHPLCLDEPAPMVIMQGFGDSAINLVFHAWGRGENSVSLRDELQERIKDAFDEASIEIPFPQLAINASSNPTPLPLQVMPAAASKEPPDAAAQ